MVLVWPLWWSAVQVFVQPLPVRTVFIPPLPARTTIVSICTADDVPDGCRFLHLILLACIGYTCKSAWAVPAAWHLYQIIKGILVHLKCHCYFSFQLNIPSIMISCELKQISTHTGKGLHTCLISWLILWALDCCDYSPSCISGRGLHLCFMGHCTSDNPVVPRGSLPKLVQDSNIP